MSLNRPLFSCVLVTVLLAGCGSEEEGDVTSSETDGEWNMTMTVNPPLKDHPQGRSWGTLLSKVVTEDGLVQYDLLDEAYFEIALTHSVEYFARSGHSEEPAEKMAML